MRGLSFVHRLGGSLHLAARFFELLFRVCDAGLVRRLVHALFEFVNIGEHLLLLFAKTFQSAPQLFTLLLRLRSLKRCLQFLKLLIHVLLALGELLKSIENLQLLALLRILLRCRLPLGFITIFLLLHFQFIQLALHLTTGGLSLSLAATLLHLKLPRLHPKQSLIGGLLGIQCRRKGLVGRAVCGVPQLFGGLLHLSAHVLENSKHLRVLSFRLRPFHHLRGFVLGLLHHVGILSERPCRSASFLLLQLEGRGDDLLLELEELLALLLRRRRRVALGVASFGLAEHLLKRPHFGEKHVGGCPARLSVRTDVIGPKIPGHQSTRFLVQLFQSEQMRKGELLIGSAVRDYTDDLFGRARDAIGQSIAQQAVIIRVLRGKVHLLKRRDFLIALRRCDLDVRTPIRQGFKNKLSR